MEALVLLRSGQIGSLAGNTRPEVVLLAVIVALGALLLLVRFLRSTEHRRRKAVRSSYFDRNAARYGSGGQHSSAGGASRSTSTSTSKRGSVRPMAPSFSSAPSAPSQKQSPCRGVTSTPARATVDPRERSLAQTVPTAPGQAPAAVKPKGLRSSGARPTASPTVAPPATTPVPGLKPRSAAPPNLPAMLVPDPPAARPRD